MGAELTCTARFNGKTTRGRARLETSTLEFRGADLKVSIPFARMTKVAADNGRLTIESRDGALTLDLGDKADRWAHKIEHPPSRLDKIAVRSHWRVSALGIDDEAFLNELKASAAQVSIGRLLKESDAIFVGATRAAELTRLRKLTLSLKADGCLWVIRPKGRPEISERAVMAAGKAAGLVDVKVVSFSPTHTAEKFVIPLRNRTARRTVI